MKTWLRDNDNEIYSTQFTQIIKENLLFLKNVSEH